MKMTQRTDPDHAVQHFMDNYGYLLGVLVLLAGFFLIGYLIIQ